MMKPESVVLCLVLMLVATVSYILGELHGQEKRTGVDKDSRQSDTQPKLEDQRGWNESMADIPGKDNCAIWKDVKITNNLLAHSDSMDVIGNFGVSLLHPPDKQNNSIYIGLNAHGTNDNEIIVSFTDGTQFRATLPKGKIIAMPPLFIEQEKQ